MQESNKLTSSPFVRFGQVEIFKIQNESFTVLWSVHAAGVAADHHTHLTEFLQYMRWSSLSTAVDNSYLGRTQLAETVL